MIDEEDAAKAEGGNGDGDGAVTGIAQADERALRVMRLKETVLVEKTRLGAGGTVEQNVEHEISVNLIDPWLKQPRTHFDPKKIQKLARSINAHGQREAIKVTVHPEKSGRYLISDGQRRWMACQHRDCQRKTIRAVVLPSEDEDQMLIHSLISNCCREGHTPYEYALAIKRLFDRGHAVDFIATIFGKSDCWVYQHQSLTKLDQRVIDMMDCHRDKKVRLKFAIAILLTSLPGDLQFSIAKEIVEEKMEQKQARYFIETKARAAGHEIGGIAHRPERRRNSFKSWVSSMSHSVGEFLNIPGTTLPDFLLGFSEQELTVTSKTMADCHEGLKALINALNEASTKLEKKRIEASRPLAKKKDKKAKAKR